MNINFTTGKTQVVTCRAVGIKETVTPLQKGFISPEKQRSCNCILVIQFCIQQYTHTHSNVNVKVH